MIRNQLIRIIPKLDIKNGLLIKGINLEGLRVLGNPYQFAEDYYNSGADEISYIDNVATLYGTNNLVKFVNKTSKNIFVPLSVGGGIKSIKDIQKMLNSGADKVSINSAAIDNPEFIREASRTFGSSTIVINIEAIKINKNYFISKSNGRDLIKINPIYWGKKVEKLGAGEIFLTSVNREGLNEGFGLQLTKDLSKSVSIPLIAHGGAGNFNHVYELIKKTNVSGVSLSSLLHYDLLGKFNFDKTSVGNTDFLKNNKKRKIKNNLKNLKKYLLQKNIKVRI